MTQDELVASIVERVTEMTPSRPSPLFVAISGMDCAGKSTLARAVHKRLTQLAFTVSLISIDDFLIPPEVKARRAPEFLGYFEDAFDYPALIRALEAARGSASEGPVDSRPDSCASVALVEGVFLLRHELRHWWNLMIWLAVEPTLVIERAVARDVAHFGDSATVRRVYDQRCRPAQAYHEQRDRPQAHAQLLVGFDDGVWTVQMRQSGG